MSQVTVEENQVEVEIIKPDQTEIETSAQEKHASLEDANSSPTAPATENMTLPLELMDQCIGKRVWVIIDSPREFVATLVAIDDFVNLVLEDVTEYDMSDPENLGIKTYKRPKMLLNAKYIAMIIPNGKGPEIPAAATSLPELATA